MCQQCAVMYYILFLVIVAVALPVEERDDIHVLRSINEAYEGSSQWENLFALMRDTARHDLAGSLDEGWSHLLALDVRYLSHGHGECNQVEQVARCLVSEQEKRDMQRRQARNVQFEVAQVRQGGVEVVRLLEVHRTDGNDLLRQLDVYFLHTRATDGKIWLIEKLPTVAAPIRLGINKFSEP